MSSLVATGYRTLKTQAIFLSTLEKPNCALHVSIHSRLLWDKTPGKSTQEDNYVNSLVAASAVPSALNRLAFPKELVDWKQNRAFL